MVAICAEPAFARTMPGSEATVRAAVSPRRVVLAEDDGALRALVREAFVAAGYEVIECKDGRRLLELLTERDCSDLAAVVSDHRMPGMLGLDVLRALGARRPKAPFILITAFGDGDLHELGKELGADLVVDKPFDEDELVEAVRTLAA